MVPDEESLTSGEEKRRKKERGRWENFLLQSKIKAVKYTASPMDEELCSFSLISDL